MATPANTPKPAPAPAAPPAAAAPAGDTAADEQTERDRRVAQQQQSQMNVNDLFSQLLMLFLKAIFGSLNDSTSEYSEIDPGNAAPSQGRSDARVAIEKPEVQAKLRTLAGKYTSLPADISPFTVNATITSGIGERDISVRGASHDHKGLDIVPVSASLEATTVHNTMPGVVVRSEMQLDKNGKPAGFGNWVEVACIDGTRRRYAHLKERDVKVGDVIDQGATIGIMGNTGTSGGAHLHYEWRNADGSVLEPTINNLTYARNDKSYIRSTVLASAAPAPEAPKLAANDQPAPTKQATHPKAPAKPAAQPTVAEQVAALSLSAKMHVADAYEGTKSAISSGMKNAQATIGNILG